MERATLPAAAVTISRIALGTAAFGSRITVADAINLVHAALDGGIDFIDTADIYGDSERILGQALVGRRNACFLATKCGSAEGSEPTPGAARNHLARRVERSLHRLRTDYIDLLQLHEPDRDTPAEETLTAIEELRAAGKVRFFGTCNHDVDDLDRLRQVSDRKVVRTVSEQSQFSWLTRSPEHGVLPYCRKHDIAFFAWSPLAAGLLAGRYSTRSPRPLCSRRSDGWWLPWNDEDVDSHLPKVDRWLEEAATQGGCPSQAALRWVLDRPGVTAAIIGPRTVRHLESALNVYDR